MNAILSALINKKKIILENDGRLLKKSFFGFVESSVLDRFCIYRYRLFVITWKVKKKAMVLWVFLKNLSG